MKEQFARVFTRQYVLVTQLLAKSPSDERVVNVSVQLLTNETLARVLVVEEHMLHRLLLSLRLLLSRTSFIPCKFIFRCVSSTLAGTAQTSTNKPPTSSACSAAVFLLVPAAASSAQLAAAMDMSASSKSILLRHGVYCTLSVHSTVRRTQLLVV